MSFSVCTTDKDVRSCQESLSTEETLSQGKICHSINKVLLHLGIRQVSDIAEAKGGNEKV